MIQRYWLCLEIPRQAPSSVLMASSSPAEHGECLCSHLSSPLGSLLRAPRSAGPSGLLMVRHVLAHFPAHQRCLLGMAALESQHHLSGTA